MRRHPRGVRNPGGEDIDYNKEADLQKTSPSPPTAIFSALYYLNGFRTAGINTNLCAPCSAGNVKLKVALPRTRLHMCNGNVAAMHMRRPASPHQRRLTL